MRIAKALATLLLLLGAATSSAQPLGGAGDVPDAASLVKAAAAAIEVRPGGTAAVRVAITIAPGWHVNANPPALDYLIATEVKVMGDAGLAPGRASYPPPRRAKLSFEDAELLVYDGQAAVEVPLSASAGAKAGRHALRGEVKFQACNDQVCLPPATVAFEVVVTVAGAATGAASPPPGPAGAPGGTEAPASGFTTTPPADAGNRSVTPGPRGAGSAQHRLEDALARGGPGWLLVLFVGGLLLNLTPCVFPMLGVTVSIFGARRREPLPKVLAAAGLYVLGIVLMYSTLGVVAALTGGLFGSALQSAWVSVGLGLLLVALSLSMFGLYEMQPPSWLLQRLGGADTTSALGLLLSGLAVGIIAAPCIGPFVVAVLALIARRGDAMFGLRTMFALSIGLGFPYLLLATFSNLLQRLPRSGDWMVWVKKVFGVILASVGAFYALVGIAPRLSGWVLPAALVLGGAYLGFLDRSAAGRTGFRRLRMAGGALAVMAGVWMVATAPKRGIEFEAFDPAALRSGLAAGKVAMLDFSADWCVPCHELERATFTDTRVKTMARSFLAYQVDLTRYDSPEAERWRRQYQITGVPTVIFLAPDGSEVRDARVEGFLSPERFLGRMRLAAGAGSAGRP